MSEIPTGKPRPGRMYYEPELPDDKYTEYLKLQERNATILGQEGVAATWWAAQHAYRVLALGQKPHFIEEQNDSDRI